MKFFKVLLLSVIILLGLNSRASHIPGLNLSYQCLGNNTYILTLTIFEDCSTAFIGNSPRNINISNSCGISFQSSFQLTNTVYQQEVSQLCGAYLDSSECSGGSMPGIYMQQWQDTIELPDTCNSWTFSYGGCCRNATDNLIGLGNSQYVETTLYSSTEPCNNSPYVTTQLIPYICVNQPLTYNLGVIDPDGDSLSFSLVDALQSPTTIVNYDVANGYSGLNPINGITINSVTGDLIFNPTLIGNFVVAVMVKEFDENGNLLGTFIHDFQFEVIPCAVNITPLQPSGISNFSGTAIQADSVTIDICPGQDFCFDVVFTDSNATDSLYITSNLANILPGATFQQLSWQSPATAQVCFQLNGSLPLHYTNIYFTAKDNACPMYGISFFTATINFNTIYIEAATDTMCYGDNVQLSVNADPNINWSVLSGDPINIGNNFSCNNCDNPIASPDSTTVYIATSSLPGLCSNSDTIEVFVSEEYNYSIIPSVTTTCVLSDVQLSLLMSPNTNNYTFAWTPASTLNDSTTQNPIATPNNSGTNTYIVEITSADGCTKHDTIDLFVNSFPNPSITNITSDTTVFCNDTLALISEVDTSLTNQFINDDFDPNINSGIWSSLQEASVGNSCTVNSGTNALYFSGISGLRYAETISLNTNTCVTIDFQLFLGNNLSAGSPCENCDPGDDVSLEYSINGGATWVLIQLFGQHLWDAGAIYANSWASFSIPLPNGAISNSTQFRWYQTPNPGGSSTGFDNWALDDVNISCASSINNYVYQWSPSGNLLYPDSLNTDLYIPSLAGTYNYNLLVTDTVSTCTDSASVELTVLCCVTPNFLSSNPTCFGYNDASIEVIPQTYPPWNISLYDATSGSLLQNVNINSGSTTFLGLSAGTYLVSISDSAGCLTDTTITLTQPNQLVLNPTNDTSICLNDSIQLNVSGANFYAWNSSSTLSDTSINNPIASPLTNTTYYVIGTDLNGCSNNDSVSISIYNLPIIIINNDTSICLGDTANLSASGGISYLWTPNDSISDNTINNPLAFPSDTTQYTVQVTDNNNCINYDSVKVNILSLPTIITSNDTSICFGDSTNLSASGGISYLWIPNDSISDNTINNPLVWPSDTAQYIVQVTDNLTCIKNDTITVNVAPLPNADAGIDFWICPGDSKQLLASGGVSYIWSPATNLTNPNVNNPIVSLIDSATYIVSVYSAMSCINTDTISIFVNETVPTDAGNDTIICQYDSIQIGGNPSSVNGTYFLWSPSNSIVNDTLANPIVFPTSPTMYYVSTSNDTCNGLDSIFIDVMPAPNVNAGINTEICIGDSTTLFSSGAVSYQWTPNTNISNDTIFNPVVYPIDTTNYIVSGTDINSCSFSDTVTIIVNPLPNADAGFNVNICEGETAQLSGSGGESYLWTPNNYLNHDTVYNPMAFVDTSMIFYVQVTDSNNCVANDSMLVIVFMIYSNNDTLICSGDTVQLNTFGEPALSFLWSPNSEISNVNLQNPIVYPTSTTTYIVTATDSRSCEDSASVLIEVANPQAIFDTDIVVSCEGEAITFNNKSDSELDFIWYFSDGNSSDLEIAEHIFEFGLPYNTILVVNDTLGCVDSSYFNGTAQNFEDYFNLSIPNVFTPNGDNENDNFGIELPERIYDCTDITIFNRWGEIIFISSGENITWDGRTSAGDLVPEGTYFYLIEIRDNVSKGSLYLFR